MRLWGRKITKLVLTIPDRLEKPVVIPLLWYRRLRYGYPFRRIRLTLGKYAIVDPDDYPRLSKVKWYAVKGGHSFYGVRGQWSGKLKKRLTIMMHRVILNVPEGFVVHHINHNGLDNRKANVRVATPADNARNARYPKTGASSRYRGVWYNKDRQKWRAQIRVNRKRKQIGYFRDEIAAAKAYDRAARKFYGEFAVLNLPDQTCTRSRQSLSKRR